MRISRSFVAPLLLGVARDLPREECITYPKRSLPERAYATPVSDLLPLCLRCTFVCLCLQRMIYKAKHQANYDPLKASMSIYMDVINIFWRMVAILQNNQRRK